MTAFLMHPADVGLLVTESSSGVGPEAHSIRDKQRDIAVEYLTSLWSGGKLRSAIEAIFKVAAQAASERWDAYDGKPVEVPAVINAARLLKYVPPALPAPEVSADPDGDISLEWHRGPRRVFSVSISARGELTYAGLFGRSTVHGKEAYFADELPAVIQANLDRVFPEFVPPGSR